MPQILYFCICTHTHQQKLNSCQFYGFQQMELQLPIKQILPVTKICYLFIDWAVCCLYFHNIHSKA